MWLLFFKGTLIDSTCLKLPSLSRKWWRLRMGSYS